MLLNLLRGVQPQLICGAVCSLKKHWQCTAPRRTSTSNALSFCVVGTGPAGFYVVDRVRRSGRHLAASACTQVLIPSIAHHHPAAAEALWTTSFYHVAGACKSGLAAVRCS